MLEINDGVVVANGRLDEPLRIAGGGGIDDFQARRVEERGLGVLRVERAAPHVAATRPPHHDGGREPGAIARGRHVVGQHVVRAGDEVDELHLRDRPHAHMGGARRRTHDRRFRDRRVDHSLLAEPFGESLSHLEGATVGADVLPQDENAGIALHLLPQALAQRLQVGDLGHHRLRYQCGGSAGGPAYTPARAEAPGGRGSSTHASVAWSISAFACPSIACNSRSSTHSLCRSRFA